MAKYHVNDKGEAGECRAKNGGCPFGGEADHYTSPEAARAAFEATMNPFASDAQAFATLAPEWVGKLPAAVESKIVAKVKESQDFVSAVDKGEVEVKYADISKFLDQPVKPYRDRGSWFVKPDEVEFGLNPPAQPGELLIAMHSRQGGGNRECYCYEENGGHEDGCLTISNDQLEENPQFVGYADDDFDSTYTTHYFRGGWTEADANKHKEQGELAQRYRKEKQSLEAISSGEIPPWSVLSAQGSAGILNAKENLKARRDRLKDQVARKEKSYAAAKIAFDKIKKGELLTDQEVADINGLSQKNWQFRNVNRDIEALNKKRENLRKIEAMVAQAEQLPDGELKDYLLGDRGTGTYNVQEKQGRRNVTVTKTYQRGTLLGEELKDKKRVYEREHKDMKETLATVKKLADDYNPKDDLKELKDFDKKVKEVWAAGWPGDARGLPSVPKDFA